MRRRFFLSTLAQTITPPPEPPSYNMALVAVNGSGHARVATRQTALEPSVAGADVPMSWSGWYNMHNTGTGQFRMFVNGETAASTQQYSLNVVAQSDQTGYNQRLNFTIFNTANTGF